MCVVGLKLTSVGVKVNSIFSVPGCCPVFPVRVTVSVVPVPPVNEMVNLFDEPIDQLPGVVLESEMLSLSPSAMLALDVDSEPPPSGRLSITVNVPSKYSNS